MFSILRFILIIGAIFYYSPVRQKGEGTDALGALLTPKKSEPAAAASPPSTPAPSGLETMWQALPDGAKRAVVDKVLTTSGLAPADAKPADTLQPQDKEPAWQGSAAKPRT
jgi:hypothetical protein